jgi:RNA polymerase sigma-70 factor (ECF subfamily)
VDWRQPVAMEGTHDFVAGLAVSHAEQLRRFLRTRVRNAADIPDIIQEVFLRLLRVPHHEAIRSPEAYLFTVARHVAQQHLLHETAAPKFAEFDDMFLPLRPTCDADPALELSAQQCLEQMTLVLQDLSPKARAAFLLHRRDGLTLEEIGKRLGISRPMVKKYLARALVQFRQRLEIAQ